MNTPSTDLRQRLVCDLVLPLAPSVGNDFALLKRFHRAGHAFVSLTIAGDDCGLGEAIHRLAQARRRLTEDSDTFLIAESADDIEHAHAQGRLAVGLHLEGTECLERDPDVLDLMYELGIRYTILAFNRNNSAAGGCADLGDVGLSRLGRRYVERIASLGMLLDLSHTGERSSLEAMERAPGPVLFTHSNVQDMHRHYRNLSPAQIRGCAASGGLIGVSGSSAYLGTELPLPEAVFRHIDRLVQTVGPAHVALGTDYVVDTAAVETIFAQRPDEWPVEGGIRYDTLSYLPPEQLPEVVGWMVKAGYDDGAIDDILGRNFLRVARQVWR